MKMMRKNEFLAELSRRTNIPSVDIDHLLQTAAKVVCEQLVHNGGTNFPHFGKVKLVTYKALPERKGINPRTGQPTVIPARANRVFAKIKLGKDFDDALAAVTVAKAQSAEAMPDEG
jgi:nucleoid DNA-binding protein